MESTNGTFVNGRQVREANLKDGDTIEGGDTTLTVRIAGQNLTEDTRQAVGPSHEETGRASLGNSSPGDLSALGPATPMDDYFVEGQLFAGFRLNREIGRGGMGIVYLAESLDDGRQVALKLMNPGQAIPQRDIDLFLREGDVLKELMHPGIVQCFRNGEFEGRFFIATEFVDGRDVGSLLDEYGPMSIRRAARIICLLLDSLEYAHSQNFVHRDIKPGNLIVTTEHGIDRIKLVDFGLAKIYQSTHVSGLTLTGEMGGSFAFAAPEQITDFRSAKPASDLYSVAATIYTMLTNRHIYDFPTTVSGIVLKLLHEDPISIHERADGIPEILGKLIHKGLARDPTDRFANAAAMRKVFRAFT